MTHRRDGRFRSIVVALLTATVGCSESRDDLPREAVSGSVTLDGELLPRGMIQFRPAGAGPASGYAVGGGSTIEDGQFSIPRGLGLTPGQYKVSINASTDRREARTKGRVVQKSGLAKELIPSKYNSETELVAEVEKGGASNLKFELRSK